VKVDNCHICGYENDIVEVNDGEDTILICQECKSIKEALESSTG